jgi:putative acetyltransferase
VGESVLVVRRAHEEDAPVIFEVHTCSIREICVSRYSAAEVEAWAGRLRPGSHLRAIRSREFFVATDDTGIAGFGQLDLGAGEVEAVYVHPRALRRGVGARLLRTLEEVARAAGLSELHLKSTLNAVTFYQRAGFRIEAQATHRISPDVELACVEMRKDLGRAAVPTV